MKTEKWYNNRLQKYFDSHYGQYTNTAEWYVNPAVNKWKCDILELGVTITFTCDDDGNVTEKRKEIK